MALISNQSDLLIDFNNYQSPLVYQYLANIIQENANESYLFYAVLSDGLNNPTLYYIDQKGNKYLTSSTTNDTYIPITSSGVIVRRPILGVGLQTDKISSFILSTTPSKEIAETFKYVALQKSVAVLIDTTNSQNNIVPSNITNNITAPATFTFDTTQSRGADVSKTVEVDVLISSFQYVPAVLNVDYTISYIPNYDTFSVTFITAKQFRLVLKVVGYDSSNNPYQINNGLICVPTGPNNDNVTYYFNATGTSYTNIINFPTIDVQMTPDVVLGTNPESTYAESNVLISPLINTSTGSWSVLNNSTGITTPRVMALSDWEDEISKKCNIQLEVRNKLTNNLVLNPFIGLNSISLYLNVGDYNLKYVISSKKPQVQTVPTTTTTSTTTTTTTTVFVPTFTQISNTDTGPGGTRTQAFQIGTTINVGNVFTLDVYSILVSVTVQSGDTPQNIIQKLITLVNSTAYPYPIVASQGATAYQISLLLDYTHQFAGSASAS